MTSSFRLENCTEFDVARIAEELAFAVQPGDVVTLSGELGAGKTTLARAMIRALLDDAVQEIPSPTYTLVQTYEARRMSVAHFDLYRLSAPEELDELGLEHCLANGIAIIEWPEQGGDLIPPAAFQLRIDDTGDFEDQPRTIEISGTNATRVERLRALHDVITSSDRSQASHLRYLQGDASVRRYARIQSAGDAGAIIMDWAEQPDGPPVRDGLPYSRIAHLAENVRPFIAITMALRNAGLSAPFIYGVDINNGFVVLEDFGNDVYQTVVASGEDPTERYRVAVDVLLTLRQSPPPANLPVTNSTPYQLPRYDAGALAIETELLTDWYWPAAYGTDIPHAARSAFASAWNPLFEYLAGVPHGWALRDFHSPNLIALPERSGVKAVGLIDVQDALRGPMAYDLVSLLQDARVDIVETVEAELLGYYCTKAAAHDSAFDEAQFRLSYAILGAQRNTKILGIFARLAKRDGKPIYLAHMPRLWRYLARDLAHPKLQDLRAWYDDHFPVERRSTPLNI